MKCVECRNVVNLDDVRPGSNAVSLVITPIVSWRLIKLTLTGGYTAAIVTSSAASWMTPAIAICDPESCKLWQHVSQLGIHVYLYFSPVVQNRDIIICSTITDLQRA